MLWTTLSAAGRLRVGALRALPALGGRGIQGACSSQAPVPLRPTQEPPGHLSEDASMKSSLPCIPRAATQRPGGDLQTLLDTDNIPGQVGKSPCSWGQKLVSTCWQPATRRTSAQWGSWGAGRSLLALSLGSRSELGSESQPHTCKRWGLFALAFPPLYNGADPCAWPLGLGYRIPLGPGSLISCPEAPAVSSWSCLSL